MFVLAWCQVRLHIKIFFRQDYHQGRIRHTSVRIYEYILWFGTRSWPYYHSLESTVTRRLEMTTSHWWFSAQLSTLEISYPFKSLPRNLARDSSLFSRIFGSLSLTVLPMEQKNLMILKEVRPESRKGSDRVGLRTNHFYSSMPAREREEEVQQIKSASNSMSKLKWELKL